jgi:hypothetical protein
MREQRYQKYHHIGYVIQGEGSQAEKRATFAVRWLLHC